MVHSYGSREAVPVDCLKVVEQKPRRRNYTETSGNLPKSSLISSQKAAHSELSPRAKRLNRATSHSFSRLLLHHNTRERRGSRAKTTDQLPCRMTTMMYTSRFSFIYTLAIYRAKRRCAIAPPLMIIITDREGNDSFSAFRK